MLSSSASASSFFPCCISRVACSRLLSRRADDAAVGAESCFDASCSACARTGNTAQALNTPAGNHRKWIRSRVIRNFPAVTKPRLEHKKRGACQEAPRRGGRASSSLLETEFEPVCQRAQLGGGGNTGDLANASTVYAPRRVRETHILKYVVELELELSLRLFPDAEVFEQG